MTTYSKADMVRFVMEALAYHDIDLLNEDSISISKYDHADFGSKTLLVLDIDKQTDRHIELHHGIPDDKTFHDDWCSSCTTEFLTRHFGKVLFDMLATSELPSTKEEVLTVATTVTEYLAKTHDDEMHKITDAVRAREELGAPTPEKLEALLANWTDDHDRVTDYYLLWLASRFPGIVSRAEQPSAIPARGNVPETVQRYFLEATRSFILGQYIACLVVCRAAIELALRDFLLRHGKETDLERLEAERRDGFSARLDLARSLGKWNLNFTLNTAREISKAAGTVLHAREISAEKCKEMFFKARGVLKDLYA
jgi:hypothetical protein